MSLVPHCGRSEFPKWCFRVAAALAIHAAGAAVLASVTPRAVPRLEPAARLLWLENEDPSAAAPAPLVETRVAGEGVAPPAAAPAPPSPASGSAPARSLAARSAPARPRPAGGVRAHAASSAPLAPEPPSRSDEPAVPALAAAASGDDTRGGTGEGTARLAAGLGLAPAEGASVARGASGARGASEGRGAGVGAGTGSGGAGGSASHGAAPAHLLPASDRCADLFPYAASSDTGTVAVSLEVASSGQPASPRIVDETPRGQGFGIAASHCIRRLRFAPAVDDRGRAVASRSVVRLRFARSNAGRRAAL